MVGELSDVFTHPIVLDGTPEARQAIMLQSSESKYRSELAYPWDNHFGCDLGPLLRGATALDLGSFDAVLLFGVFEHIQSVGRTLDEVFRVLHPDGRLFLVFLGYYQPVEHHLGLVTKTPSLGADW